MTNKVLLCKVLFLKNLYATKTTTVLSVGSGDPGPI